MKDGKENTKAKPYFNTLYKSIENPLFKKHLLNYLLHRDVSAFDYRTPIETAIKAEMKQCQEPPIIQFIKSYEWEEYEAQQGRSYEELISRFHT
jgi:hypothetical protein